MGGCLIWGLFLVMWWWVVAAPAGLDGHLVGVGARRGVVATDDSRRSDPITVLPHGGLVDQAGGAAGGEEDEERASEHGASTATGPDLPDPRPAGPLCHHNVTPGSRETSGLRNICRKVQDHPGQGDRQAGAQRHPGRHPANPSLLVPVHERALCEWRTCYH